MAKDGQPFASRVKTSPVTALLDALSPLTAADRAIVDALSGAASTAVAGNELAPNSSATGEPRFLISGWASLQRLLSDGRRQIFSFLVPGDLIDRDRLKSIGRSTQILALTQVQTVDARPVVEAGERKSPTLGEALRALDAVGERRLLDHIVRLGRQTAYERVAHLLLELHHRLWVVNLANDGQFPLPLTQETLADALGLSNVHVNRVLQQLRRDGMLELRSGRAALLKPQVLALTCDFSPS